LGPNKGQNKENLINHQKSSHELLAEINTLTFGMDHPWGKEIKRCSNKVPRVMYGPTPGA